MGQDPGAKDEALAKDIDRWRRKGWSDAKIARAADAAQKADARPSGHKVDSLEQWAEALSDLAADLRLPYAGLLVRFYAGDQGAEVFTVSRHDIGARPLTEETLAAIKPDQVTIFRLA